MAHAECDEWGEEFSQDFNYCPYCGEEAQKQE